MKIEIKHIYRSTVLFSHEKINNSIKITLELAVKDRTNLEGSYLRGADLEGAYLRCANLEGADLRCAYLRGANLEGAYLRGADLKCANLEGADLEGANLRGANLEGANYGDATLKNGLLQLLGKYWPIYIFDVHIKIGCQMHSTSDWESFSDERISEMASNALEFWKDNKEMILAVAKNHQKKSGEQK